MRGCGDASGSAVPLRLTMDGDKTVVAIFSEAVAPTSSSCCGTRAAGAVMFCFVALLASATWRKRH